MRLPVYKHWRAWACVGLLRIALGAGLFCVPGLRFSCFVVCPELGLATELAGSLLAQGWGWPVSSGAFCIPVAALLVEVDTLLLGYAVTVVGAVFTAKQR